jgi:hypothetical protein
MPRTIRAAARSAFIESSGREAAVPNHAYSRPWSPTKWARRCEPVRIKPGATVVTDTPVPLSSDRRPRVKPTAPNLAVL